jgi:hypothetical protein
LAPTQVDLLRRVLKGESLISPSEALQIERSLPHGHVAAALGTLRRIGLESDLARLNRGPYSRPGFQARHRTRPPPANCSSSLGALLGFDQVDEDHLYAAMDWLLSRQARAEDKLAGRHLQQGTIVLYDVTSTYFQGRHRPLARYGHSRDERPGNLQIVFGLLTNHEGCPGGGGAF